MGYYSQSVEQPLSLTAPITAVGGRIVRGKKVQQLGLQKPVAVEVALPTCVGGAGGAGDDDVNESAVSSPTGSTTLIEIRVPVANSLPGDGDYLGFSFRKRCSPPSVEAELQSAVANAQREITVLGDKVADLGQRALSSAVVAGRRVEGFMEKKGTMLLEEWWGRRRGGGGR